MIDKDNRVHLCSVYIKVFQNNFKNQKWIYISFFFAVQIKKCIYIYDAHNISNLRIVWLLQLAQLLNALSHTYSQPAWWQYWNQHCFLPPSTNVRHSQMCNAWWCHRQEVLLLPVDNIWRNATSIPLLHMLHKVNRCIISPNPCNSIRQQ